MLPQKLIEVESIPFKSFKEKIRLTKQYRKDKVEILGNSVIVIREVETDGFRPYVYM